MLKLRKIIDYIKYNSLLIGMLIVVFIITINIIDVSGKNQTLKQQEIEQQLEIENLKLEIWKQEQENQFKKTDYYSELLLRQQKGHVLEGEQVIIIKPEKIDDQFKAYQPTTVEEESKLEDLSNLEQWQHFIFKK